MAGERITDPEILAQLGMGGAPAAAAPRVVVPAALPPLKPLETPGGRTEAAKGEAPVPTQQIFQELSANKTQLATALSRLGRVEQLYNRSLKGNEPWRVIREYFPGVAPRSSVSKDVERLRSAGSQLYALSAQITRIPGEGDPAYREYLDKLEAFKIFPSDKDETIEEKISGLRDLLDRRLKFVDERMSEVRPRPSTAMRAAKATVNPPKRLRYDAQGNLIP